MAGEPAVVDELLELAEATLTNADAQGTARSTAEAAVRRSEHEVVAAQRAQAEAEAALKEWKKMWPQSRIDGGLPDSTTPEAAHEIVRAIEEALAQTEAIGELTRRIAAIDADREEFEQRIEGLSAEIATDLVGLSPEGGLMTLVSRLNDASASANRRTSLSEQLDAARDAVDEAEHNEELDQLIRHAGCRDAADLPEIEKRAARVRELRTELTALVRQAEEIAEEPFDRLQEAADGFDRTAAALELASIRDRVTELSEARDQRKIEIGERRQRLLDAEGSVAAVDAVQDVELARVRAAELADGKSIQGQAATGSRTTR